MMPETLSLLKLPKRSLESRGAASRDVLRYCLRRAMWDVRRNPKQEILPKIRAGSMGHVEQLPMNEKNPLQPLNLPSPQTRHHHGPCSSQPWMAKETVSYAGVLWVGSLFRRITANAAVLPWVFKACTAFPAAPATVREKYLLTTETLVLHQWIKA